MIIAFLFAARNQDNISSYRRGAFLAEEARQRGGSYGRGVFLERKRQD
jgi:hypothetical protein